MTGSVTDWQCDGLAFFTLHFHQAVQNTFCQYSLMYSRLLRLLISGSTVFIRYFTPRSVHFPVMLHIIEHPKFIQSSQSIIDIWSIRTWIGQIPMVQLIKFIAIIAWNKTIIDTACKQAEYCSSDIHRQGALLIGLEWMSLPSDSNLSFHYQYELGRFINLLLSENWAWR